MCSKTLGPAMLPSFVTCPIMMVVIWCPLETLIILDVISRTWLTVPAADVISSEYIVWIESIITSLGFIARIVSSITSISVSPKNIILLFFIPSLSALNLTCSADSSPETYKTFPVPVILSQSSNIRVDFPIPGSPPSKTSEPLTSPPPKTLLSSPIPVSILDSFFPTTSSSTCGTALSFTAFPVTVDLVSTTFCSKKVFQLLQAGHFPSHFGDSYPHSLHTKTVFAFAICTLLFINFAH